MALPAALRGRLRSLRPDWQVAEVCAVQERVLLQRGLPGRALPAAPAAVQCAAKGEAAELAGCVARTRTHGRTASPELLREPRPSQQLLLPVLLTVWWPA